MNYTVRSGDTMSKIILLQYAIDNKVDSTLLDCLIRYVSTINNRNVDLYDNIDSNRIEDPDSLKPGQVLIIPDTLQEIYADPIWKQFTCYQAPSNATPDQKNNKWLWIGGGLLALGAIYFLTKKKKGKRR
jgi:LPXTG-motif cell wall-anchored protein